MLGTVVSTSHVLVHLILTATLWEDGGEQVSLLASSHKCGMQQSRDSLPLNHLTVFQCIDTLYLV